MEGIKLRYSEQFIREALRAYWRKQIGVLFPLATVLLMGFFIYRLANGDRSWVVGTLGSVIALGIITITASYYVHLGRSMKRLRRMKKPEATLDLGDESFRITSDVGSSEIKWSLIRRVWCFEKIWLLFFSAGEFMTLPISDIPADSREFIVSKAKANGAKIA